MVVFIFDRNLNTNNTCSDLENVIEDVNGFNVMIEHSNSWREENTKVFNEETNKKRNAIPDIIIDVDVKKSNGTKVNKNDIIDSFSFGNGITLGTLVLKNGEKVEACWVVFPNARKGSVQAKIAQLKTIMRS